MAPVSATSKITKVRLNFDPENPEAGGVFLPEIFTATKVTRTGETNADGGPVYKTEVIRYDNAKGDNPIVIATSSSISRNDNRGNENYDSRLVPTDNATPAEKVSMGLAIRNAQLDQVRSVQDQVASSPKENRELFKVGGSGSQTENSDLPPVISEEAPSVPVQDSAPGGNNSTDNSFPPPPPARSSFQTFIYPADIGKTGQDTIKFSILERKPRGELNTGGGRTDPATRTQAAVVLPIPGNLSDQNNVSYKESSLNALQLAGAEDLINAMTQDGTGQIGKNISSVLTSATSTGNNDLVKKLIASKAASSALNLRGTNELLSRTTGTILNPNMELLFNSPTLRSFGFVFKLSPRSQPEAETVIAILRFFKQSMVPRVAEGNLFLQSPSSFKVEYMHRGNANHPGLNRFKECALENCQVNYTPEGTYNTMRDGIMPSYELTLRFRELDPVFSSDYDQADQNPTGSRFATFRENAAENAAIQPRFGSSGIGF